MNIEVLILCLGPSPTRSVSTSWPPMTQDKESLYLDRDASGLALRNGNFKCLNLVIIVIPSKMCCVLKIFQLSILQQ